MKTAPYEWPATPQIGPTRPDQLEEVVGLTLDVRSFAPVTLSVTPSIQHHACEAICEQIGHLEPVAASREPAVNQHDHGPAALL